MDLSASLNIQTAQSGAKAANNLRAKRQDLKEQGLDFAGALWANRAEPRIEKLNANTAKLVEKARTAPKEKELAREDKTEALPINDNQKEPLQNVSDNEETTSEVKDEALVSAQDNTPKTDEVDGNSSKVEKTDAPANIQSNQNANVISAASKTIGTAQTAIGAINIEGNDATNAAQTATSTNQIANSEIAAQIIAAGDNDKSPSLAEFVKTAIDAMPKAMNASQVNTLKAENAQSPNVNSENFAVALNNSKSDFHGQNSQNGQSDAQSNGSNGDQTQSQTANQAKPNIQSQMQFSAQNTTNGQQLEALLKNTIDAQSKTAQSANDGANLDMQNLAQAGVKFDPVGAQNTAIANTNEAAKLNVPAMAATIFRKHQNGDKSISVRLDPAELGAVRVELKIDAQKKLTAIINVEKADALKELSNNSANLLQSLRDAGLDVADNAIEFQLDTNPNNTGGAQNWAEQNQSQQSNNGNNNGAKLNQENDADIQIINNVNIAKQTTPHLEIWQRARVSLEA